MKTAAAPPCGGEAPPVLVLLYFLCRVWFYIYYFFIYFYFLVGDNNGLPATRFRNIVQMPNGDFMAVGSGGSLNNRDVFVVRADGSGNEIWQTCFSETVAEFSIGYVDVNAAAELKHCPNCPPTQSGNEEGWTINLMPDGGIALGCSFDWAEDAGNDCVFGNGSFGVPNGNEEQYYDFDMAMIKIDPDDGSLLYGLDAGRWAAIDGYLNSAQNGNNLYMLSSKINNLADPCADPLMGEVWGGAVRVIDEPNQSRFRKAWMKHTRGKTFEFCPFAVCLASDGGVVMGGNNANNGDDYEVIKLSSDCFLDEPFDTYSQTVSGSVTWDTPKRVFGTIRIPNNATLKIQGTIIRFANTYLTNDWQVLASSGFTGGGAQSDPENVYNPTKIIIEPGGKLVIDAAVLTGIDGCGREWMWEGVTVLGDQTKSPSSINQGLVSMLNNGRIEHAYIGVHAGSTYYNSSGRHASTGVGGGGLVQSLQPVISQGAHFLNCLRGAWIAPYNYTGQGYTNPTVRFENTNFITTQSNYLNDVNLIDSDGEPIGHAFMLGSWDRDYIRVIKCRFESTTNFPVRMRGIGVDLADAQMAVIDSDFNHLREGAIARYYNDASEPFRVWLSRFDDVKKGISILEGMGHSVESSHFFNPPTGSNDPLDASIAIHLLGTNGATINKANHFEGTGEHDYGIVSRQTETMPTLVQDNFFNNLRSGIQTEEDNNGAQIRCNQFAQHFRAWSINPISPAPTWFSDQGDCGQFLNQAGNKFLDNASNCSNQNWKHHIESSIAFEYRYRNLIFEKPECSSSNVTLFQCFPDQTNTGSCAPAPPPCDPCPLTSLEAAIEDEENPFEKQRLQIELIGAYFGEGQIEDGLTLLQTAFPNEKMLQINALIEHGFYSEAQNSIASISPTEIENWVDFQSFFNILIDLGQNQKTVWQLSENQIAQLSTIANSSSKARFRAQALLELRSGERIIQPIEQWPNEFDSEGSSDRSKKTVVQFETSRLNIAPNPVKDKLSINWSLPNLGEIARLEVFSSSGSLIWSEKVNTSDQSTELDAATWPDGLFFVTLRHFGGRLVTSQFSINTLLFHVSIVYWQLPMDYRAFH